MSNIIKIQALFLSSALLMFGGGLQGLLLSVRGAEEGFSIIAIGLIGTGWSLGFITGSILVPMLVRRTGHIRAYSVMAAFGTIAILCNLLWISETGWIILRVLSGFCFAGAAMVVESWLNEMTDNKSRGTIFSLYVMVNMTFLTLGQLSISYIGILGYLPFIIGAMAFVLAILPTALTTRQQPRPLASAKIDLKLLILTSPIAVIASFCIGMANGTFYTLAPVFGLSNGLSVSEIAVVMSVAMALGALSQVPFGRLSDKIDRRWVISGTGIFAAIIGLIMASINLSSGWVLYSLFALYGFSAFPIYAVAVAHANDAANDGQFARIAAGMLLTFGFGLAIGPLIASWLMSEFSPSAMFAVTACVHALVAVSAFIRMKLRPVENPEEYAPFRAMPLGRNSTLATMALDPRADEL